MTGGSGWPRKGKGKRGSKGKGEEKKASGDAGGAAEIEGFQAKDEVRFFKSEENKWKDAVLGSGGADDSARGRPV